MHCRADLVAERLLEPGIVPELGVLGRLPEGAGGLEADEDFGAEGAAIDQIFIQQAVHGFPTDVTDHFTGLPDSDPGVQVRLGDAGLEDEGAITAWDQLGQHGQMDCRWSGLGMRLHKGSRLEGAGGVAG